MNPAGSEPQVRVVIPTTYDTADDPAVTQVVLVGTVGDGLYRSIDGGENYTRISNTGAGLPGGSVTDIVGDPNDDDVYYAGVAGRGVYRSDDAGATWDDVNDADQVWETTDAGMGWTEITRNLESINDRLQSLAYVPTPAEDVNQDDLIRLVRNAANPLLLDVFLNSLTPVLSVPLAALQQINIFGVGGNDTATIDSSNGLVSVPGGIRYDGDGACPLAQPGYGYDPGFDTLILEQTDGDLQTSDTYSVGPASGSGTSVIEGPSGVQTVHFEELEPVLDLVPAMDLVIKATTEANLIQYAAATDTSLGQVTIDDDETIVFGEKSALTINAGLGDDTVLLDNPLIPSGLTQIAVSGGAGNDSVVNRSSSDLP